MGVEKVVRDVLQNANSNYISVSDVIDIDNIVTNFNEFY